MAQMTVRLDDELLDRVRHAAATRGRSMNDYVGVVLDAATDPELAGSEAERLRERLSRAGLLVPVSSSRPRPSRAQVARARAAAGIGTPLSTLVSEGR
jgi:plasmid stability protein